MANIPVNPSHPILSTALTRLEADLFSGYAINFADVSQRLIVEIVVDEHPLKLVRAQQLVPELLEGGVGDGCYGFTFSLGADVLRVSARVSARLANVGSSIGGMIALDRSLSGQPARSHGAVRWVGGLRLAGWVRARDTGRPEKVRALFGDSVVAEASAERWGDPDAGHVIGHDAAGFDLFLPSVMADGHAQLVRVVDERGLDLTGSPLSLVAYHDGLRQFLVGTPVEEEERLRARLYDEIMPMSAPFSAYSDWKRRFQWQRSEKVSSALVGLIVVGERGANDTLDDLASQSHQLWTAAVIPDDETGLWFSATDLSSFLATEEPPPDYVIVVSGGTRLHPDAFLRLAVALDECPSALASYGDVALQGADGSSWPLFYPAFDYERCLEQGYIAPVFMARRSTISAGLDQNSTTSFRLFTALLDAAGAATPIMHVPGVLATLPPLERDGTGKALQQATAAHLKVRGVDAHVELSAGALLPAVRVRRRISSASVSIIIPTRDEVSYLRRCLDSIAQRPMDHIDEILVIDNGSTDPDALTYLDQINGDFTRVIRRTEPFNYARLNNAAAKSARGDFLLFLNNDTEAVSDDWLTELISRAEPDVGAVGSMLLWPNGLVQHGGVVIGPYHGAIHAFKDRLVGDPGYGDLLRVAHEVSAVTAACLLTRSEDFWTINGFDEHAFPIAFNDVDYCLRLRARGKRIIQTPFSVLLHHESVSRGPDERPDRKPRFDRELANLRLRWGPVLANDPCYSPLLGLDERPYSALAWPPRSTAARNNISQAVLAVPPGF